MTFSVSKTWCFVGGLAAAALVGGLSKAQCVRNGVVHATAQGMIIKDNVSEKVQSIKDEAEDITADARAEAQKIAEEAELKAEIEKRVRAEVEKELAKSDEKATKTTRATKAAK